MVKNSENKFQKHLNIKFIKTKKNQDSDHIACDVIIPNIKIDLNLLTKVMNFPKFSVFNAERYQMIIRLVRKK